MKYARPNYIGNLNPDANIRLEVPPGWTQAGDPHFLYLLGKGLNIDPKEIAEDADQSIPNYFARAWLFHQHLTDEYSPVHDEHVQEFRCLLALHCFREIFRLPVTFKDVVIPTKAENEREYGNHPYFKRLYMNLPEPKELWRKFRMVYYAGTLVGASSPLSYFFTKAAYEEQCNIPWCPQDERGLYPLSDPVPFLLEKGFYGQLYGLYEWLIRLRDNPAPGLDSSHRSEINRLLETWLSDIRNGFQANNQPIRGDIPYQHGDDSLKPIRRVGDNLQSETIRESSVRLQSRLVDNNNAPLILHESLLDSNLIIHEDIAGNMIDWIPQPSGDQLVLMNGETVPAAWVHPTLAFLTPRIARIALNREAVSNHAFEKGRVDGDKSCFTLPLTAEFFRYFTYSDIRDILAIQPVKEGVKVTLTLSLSSGKHSFSRVYRESEITRVQTTPLLELWPNFIRPKDNPWRLYYLYYASPNDESLYSALKFYPALPDGHVQRTEMRYREDPFKRDLFLLDEFPRMIRCEYEADGIKKQDHGIILLKDPLTVTASNEEWTVGVDLGTSNTNVYYLSKVNPTKAEPLSFSDRTLSIADSSAQIREDYLNDRFFHTPYSDRKTIIPDFPTLLVRFLAAHAHQDALFDGIAYFPPKLINWIFEEEVGTSAISTIEYNLKWDPRGRSLLPIFTEHLLIMIAAEAAVQYVKDIELRWSFPSSFSDLVVGQIREFWSQTVENLNRRNIGIHFTIQEEGVTESVCVCRYILVDRKGTPAADNPCVSVDIGGGSTDIAVWYRGDMLAQISLILGGNNVLPLYLEKNPDRLQAICSSLHYAPEKVSRISNLFKKYRDPVINSLMHDVKHEEIRNLLFRESHGLDEYLMLRWTMHTFLSGIAYFTGLLLHAIETERHITNGSSRLFQLVYLFFAGKGSFQLNWIKRDFDKYSDVLKKFVQAGYKNDYLEVIMHPAAHPKHEVCRGLVYDTHLANASNPVSIVGESHYTNDEGREVSVDESLEEMRGEILIPPRDFSETYLAEFVRLLNQSANVLADENPHSFDLRSLTNRIRDSVSQSQSENRAEHQSRRQPMFVYELKALMDHIRSLPVK